MAKITLGSAMKNFGPLEDRNLESDTSYMGTYYIDILPSTIYPFPLMRELSGAGDEAGDPRRALPFFDGAQRTTRPRESPSSDHFIKIDVRREAAKYAARDDS